MPTWVSLVQLQLCPLATLAQFIVVKTGSYKTANALGVLDSELVRPNAGWYHTDHASPVLTGVNYGALSKLATGPIQAAKNLG